MFSFSIVSFLFCFLGSSVAQSPLTWEEVEYGGDIPGVRSAAHLAYDQFSECLYMFGGDDNYMWRFDLDSKNWTILHNGTGTAPETLFYAYYGVVRVGDTSLFVISHGITLEEVEPTDTWIFNTQTNSWSLVETSGPTPGPRYGGHYGVFNNSLELWVGAGFGLTVNRRLIDTYILSFASSNPLQAVWTRIHKQPTLGNQYDPLTPNGRCLQSSAVLEDEKMVMWGGCMNDGRAGGPCPADDSWYFDNNQESWNELPRCATPRVWSGMAPLTNLPGKALLYGGSTAWSGQVISAEEWPKEEVLIVDVNEQTWTRYMTQAVNNQFPGRRYDHMMAEGKNGDIYMFGGILLSDDSYLNDLWVLRGNPADTSTIDCASGWVSVLHIHGLFMAVAFGILFPTGFFVARFFRCKGEGIVSKVWFIVHVIIQVSAIIITIPAFVIVFYAGASAQPEHPHAVIGIILMTLMVIQPINGIFRPHIKKDKTKSYYRIIWEWFHRCYGIFIILLGFIQVTLGMFLIVPPRPVWIVWILMLFAWVILFIVLEVIKVLRIFLCSSGAEDKKVEIEMK